MSASGSAIVTSEKASLDELMAELAKPEYYLLQVLHKYEYVDGGLEKYERVIKYTKAGNIVEFSQWTKIA